MADLWQYERLERERERKREGEKERGRERGLGVGRGGEKNMTNITEERCA